MKKKNFFIPVAILLLMPLLFIYSINNTTAQECQECDVIETSPGNYKRCIDSPVITLSSETVSRNDYITVKIDSNSVGSAPYNWTISGTGFHFNSSTGPTTEETDYPTQELQIFADGSACGSAIITVQDDCQKPTPSTASIRVPEHGKWVLVHDESCGEVEPCGGYTWCDCTLCSTVEVGIYKYQDCWIGGNCSIGSRYTSYGCSKWAYTEDYSSKKCSCAGYMISFGIVGMWSHKQWEWRCN